MINSADVLAAARAYIDDGRDCLLPGAHELAVALCEIADDRDRLRVDWLVEHWRARQLARGAA